MKLKDTVKHQLRLALLEFFPIWEKEDLVDLRRTVKFDESGGSSIDIEPYRGTRTSINFRRKVLQSPTFVQLVKVIQEESPELSGYISFPEGSIYLQDTFALIATLMNNTENKNYLTLEECISAAIFELEEFLENEIVDQETLTLINGLKLPREAKEIHFEDNVYLRQVEKDELSKFATGDVYFPNEHNSQYPYVSTALMVKKRYSISITPNYPDIQANFSFIEENQLKLENIFLSLHLLKSGRASVMKSYITLQPPVLPNMIGRSSYPSINTPFGTLELTKDEISDIQSIYQKISQNRRAEIKVSLKRLMDSENRSSAIDALLDCVIGLETLLNPMDSSELSFRVALNYAYLGEASVRRKRYDELKHVQKIRNRVVHGGLKLSSSKEVEEFNQALVSAKECLRNTLREFLFNPEFLESKKLDADFWLDRIIPPL